MHADEIHAWRQLITQALDENQPTKAAHLGLELAKRLERDAQADEIAREDLAMTDYWNTPYGGGTRETPLDRQASRVKSYSAMCEGIRPSEYLGQNGQQ